MANGKWKNRAASTTVAGVGGVGAGAAAAAATEHISKSSWGPVPHKGKIAVGVGTAYAASLYHLNRRSYHVGINSRRDQHWNG